MAVNQNNVVYLSDELARLKEAERILISRIRLDRSRKLSDFDYAQAAMEIHIKEVAWAKRWGIR